MMSKETSDAIDRIEWQFLFDVNEVTVGLFYLLQAMELASISFEKAPVAPRLKHLRVWPAVSTAGPDMLGQNGVAVQLACKGWVADIFGKWERSREKIKALVGDGGICPEVDCMGDFRRIRNDLIHGGGFATKEWSGKCTVLEWFKPGDRMILTTNHVLDFLNQMNHIMPPIPIGQQMVSWMLVPDAVKPTSLQDEQIRLVSIRMGVDTDGEPGSRRYMISAVFSDGVFGDGEIGFPGETKQYLEGYVDRDGNIVFPVGQYIDASILYDACYGYLQGDRKAGPGISGPITRYMK